jgi:UDP-glucose-4-epimerase GalE
MKHVLVTGGAGYIGSHTAKALAAHGYEPVVLDNLSEGHESAVRWGPLVQGNIGDERLVRETIGRYKIDAVIHFAANAYVGESMEQPRKYFDNNVSNSLKLLNAAIDAGVRRVVFSSTCATYGVPRALPIGEDHPQLPVNPYGESKVFVERALAWYGQAYGLSSVCLRYFNAAGADPDGEIGERHDPETHLIPLAIRAALGTQAPLRIYGADYETPDGTAVRDFVHVSDLADAHVRAMAYLAKGGATAAMNLGVGEGRSILDVLHAIERVSGRRVPAVRRKRRPGDPAVLVAQARRARKMLGWKPRFTELDAIIETAWRWHRGETTVTAGAAF